MVAAGAWMERRHTLRPSFSRWAPLVGGAVLLGFLGAGGARTDVAAHLMGFLCGSVLGAVHARWAHRRIAPRNRQAVMGAVAVAVLAMAWAIALTN
jgi:membrane associated rhomboid family serine protease